MTLEELVMDAIIGALVGGLVTVIAAVIGYVGVVKKDYGNLKESISDKFNNVFMGHNNLSNEHNNLSNEHTQIQKQQNEIKQVVIYLKENTLCEQAKKEILSQQALDIQRTSEHISALVDLLHNTQIENLPIKTRKSRTQI